MNLSGQTKLRVSFSAPEHKGGKPKNFHEVISPILVGAPLRSPVAHYPSSTPLSAHLSLPQQHWMKAIHRSSHGYPHEKRFHISSIKIRYYEWFAGVAPYGGSSEVRQKRTYFLPPTAQLSSILSSKVRNIQLMKWLNVTCQERPR